MIYEEVTIENFRGIRICHVEHLGQINIFFGKNNCGKSSLLEALFLLTGQSNPMLPLQVNNIRGINVSSEDDVTSIFYRSQKENIIEIKSKGEATRHLKISLSEEPDISTVQSDKKKKIDSTPISRFAINLKYETGAAADKHYSKIILAGGKATKVVRDPGYKEKIIGSYIASGSMINDERRDLEDIIKNKEESHILDGLKLLEPRIQGIQLVGRKIMADVGLPTLLPINVLGDGTRRVLPLLLSIFKMRGGLLFMDEIENGLHYSVMEGLWTTMMHAAIKFGTQIFISTHSTDIIKSLINAHAAMDGGAPTVSAYKLIRKDDDELMALRYDAAQLSYVSNQEIEVR